MDAFVEPANSRPELIGPYPLGRWREPDRPCIGAERVTGQRVRILGKAEYQIPPASVGRATKKAGTLKQIGGTVPDLLDQIGRVVVPPDRAVVQLDPAITEYPRQADIESFFAGVKTGLEVVDGMVALAAFAGHGSSIVVAFAPCRGRLRRRHRATSLVRS
jgi:hypothetical protein